MSKNLKLWCCLALVPLVLACILAFYGRYRYEQEMTTATAGTEDDWELNERELERNSKLEVLGIGENEMVLNLEPKVDSLTLPLVSPEYLEAEAEIARVRQELTEEMDEDLSAEAASDEMLEMDADGNPVIYDVQEGEWLASIALKLYGNRCFWGYIFDVNRDMLRSYRNVQAGTQLYLPDKKYFGIDSTDNQSIQRAAIHSAELLNNK